MTELLPWEGWQQTALPEKKGIGDEARAFERIKQKRDNEYTCLVMLKTRQPSLYAGEPECCVKPSNMNRLFESICEGVSNRDHRDRHNFLVRGLARGVRELNWSVAVPAPLQIFQTRSSVLSMRAQRDRAEYRDLVDAAMRDLAFGEPNQLAEIPRKKQANAPIDVQAGQLLFFAVMRGMLINNGWLSALPAAIKRGVGDESGNGSLGVSLELCMADMQGKSAKIAFTDCKMTRRWFPDPLTGLLLHRWYRNYGRTWPESDSLRLIRRYLKALGLSVGCVKSIAWLLRQGEQDAAMDFPPFLVNFASSLEQGASLPPECWRRLNTGTIDARNRHRSLYESERMAISGECQLPKMSPIPPEKTDLLAGLRTLRKCVAKRPIDKKERSSRSAAEALDRYIESPDCNSQILKLLALWLVSRLRAKSFAGKQLKPASAVRYLQSVGRPLLIASMEAPNVDQYEAEDWTALYERAVVSSFGNECQATRRQVLAYFHSWLVRRFDVPAVTIEGESKGFRNVDAHILTPREYARARAWLRGTDHGRLGAMRALVLTLGYRCGLRRSEVQRLGLSDLEGILEPGFERPALRVTNKPGVTSKSASGVRRLPLWLFLTKTELSELRTWVRARDKERSGEGRYALVFHGLGRPTEPVSDKNVFQAITRAMITASGCAETRFHHNRHSFATLMMLRLMENSPGALIPEHWVRDEGHELLLPHWGEDFSALAALGAAGAPTQKHLWALCNWCGHISPAETMATYSHLVDWMLGKLVLERRNTELSHKAQAVLLGVKESGLEKFRNRNQIAGKNQASDLLVALEKRWKRFLQEPRSHHRIVPHAPDLSSIADREQGRISAIMLYDIMRQLDRRADADPNHFAVIADAFDEPEATIREWNYRAELLSQLRTPRGTTALRFHRTQPRKPRQLPRSRPDYAPATETFIAPPRERHAQREVDRLYFRLAKLFLQEPALVLQVLASATQNFQRTKTRVQFRKKKDRRELLNVLDAIGLKSRTFVNLKLAKGLDDKAAKAHWAEFYGIPPSRIFTERAIGEQKRPLRLGTAHPDFLLDNDGIQRTWGIVEYVLVAAIVLIPPVEMVGGVFDAQNVI